MTFVYLLRDSTDIKSIPQQLTDSKNIDLLICLANLKVAENMQDGRITITKSPKNDFIMYAISFLFIK